MYKAEVLLQQEMAGSFLSGSTSVGSWEKQILFSSLNRKIRLKEVVEMMKNWKSGNISISHYMYV